MSDDRADVEARIRTAADAKDWRAAAAAAFDGYGEEILGYLVALMRNETDADDAFSMFCENMCKALPGFQWQCTFRTWAYTLARHAGSRVRRDPHRRRALPIEDHSLEVMVARLRSRTATFLRTEMRDKMAKLRSELEPDDQTLLILRLSRGLTWREIARVIAAENEADDGPALDRRAAALRKRFERLKTDIKTRARALETE